MGVKNTFLNFTFQSEGCNVGTEGSFECLEMTHPISRRRASSAPPTSGCELAGESLEVAAVPFLRPSKAAEARQFHVDRHPVQPSLGLKIENEESSSGGQLVVQPTPSSGNGWVTYGQHNATVRLSKKHRPCKGKRERHQKFMDRVMQEMEQNPCAFDIQSLELPPSLSSNGHLRTRCLAKLQAHLEHVLSAGSMERRFSSPMLQKQWTRWSEKPGAPRSRVPRCHNSARHSYWATEQFETAPAEVRNWTQPYIGNAGEQLPAPGCVWMERLATPWM